MSVESQKREEYVDGIKGIACLLIFFFHFNIAFVFAVPEWERILITHTPIKTLLDGNYIVYIFCLISGFVVCRTCIVTGKQLAEKIIFRYLRFSLPIFVAYLLVYLMGFIWGFPVNKASLLCENYPLSNYYLGFPDWKALFYEPFVKIWISGSSVITPLWMIRYLFYGSVIIYFYIYICNRFLKSERAKNVLLISIVCILVVLDIKMWLVLTTFLGLVMYKIKDKIFPNQKCWLWIALLAFCVFMIWTGHEMMYKLAKGVMGLPEVFNLNGHWKMLYAFLIFLAISKLSVCKSFFSKSLIMKCSKISFAIFLLHFPLICSFSMWLYFVLSEMIENSNAVFGIVFATTWVVLLLLATIFHRYIEQRIDITINKLKLFLHKV